MIDVLLPFVAPLIVLVAMALDRSLRTARMLGAVIAVAALAFLAGSLASGVVRTVMSLALGPLAVGFASALRLTALTPAEQRLNTDIAQLAARYGLSGPADGLVSPPPDIAEALAAVDRLSPPDPEWGRVLRLTRAYLVAVPEGETRSRTSLDQFFLWRAVWFDVCDRRVLGAKRLTSDNLFEADMLLDLADANGALAVGDVQRANELLDALERRPTSSPSLIERRAKAVASLWTRIEAQRAPGG